MPYRKNKEKFLYCLGFNYFYFCYFLLKVCQPCNCFIDKKLAALTSSSTFFLAATSNSVHL